MTDLQTQFGNIDIYLFDQLLRGRITPGMRVLDAGCGNGRNIHYLLRLGYEVFVADTDARAISAVRELVLKLAPQLPVENFRVESVESMTFPAEFADVVVSSAILHFANDEAQFKSMLTGSWRTLKHGGLFFCRLASSIGIENRVQHIANGRYKLPDGSERFLVDETMLMRLGQELGGELIDPIKTTVVQNKRSMTTWVLQRVH
jgi:tellurite methyltransferase